MTFTDEQWRASTEHKLLERKIKYQFFAFLTALIFTSLSLSIQFQINTTIPAYKIIEIISWILFVIAGLLSLIFIRRLWLGKNIPEWSIWVSFIFAIILQIVSKSLSALGFL